MSRMLSGGYISLANTRIFGFIRIYPEITSSFITHLNEIDILGEVDVTALIHADGWVIKSTSDHFDYVKLQMTWDLDSLGIDDKKECDGTVWNCRKFLSDKRITRFAVESNLLFILFT